MFVFLNEIKLISFTIFAIVYNKSKFNFVFLINLQSMFVFIFYKSSLLHLRFCFHKVFCTATKLYLRILKSMTTYELIKAIPIFTSNFSSIAILNLKTYLKYL